MATEASIHERPQDARLAAWFAPLHTHGTRWGAQNLDTHCAFLRVGSHELPLTANDAEWDNSWVCSPFTHYVSYAEEEIRNAVPGPIAIPLTLLWRMLGRWLRAAEFNRVVMVNNWLMSTNPWPVMEDEAIRSTIESLRARWPAHALVFRSLNEKADVAVLNSLRRHGARLVPSRQIWWFEPGSKAVQSARAWKKDRRLLRQGDLDLMEHDSLREEDFPALAALYHELYLQKYSRHNPAYTADWLLHLWRERLLRFTALREPSGALVGVEACGVFAGTMVSPVVGYSLAQAPAVGLYRRLAAIPVLAAQKENVPLNLSAGVGRFKALRGGEPVMEHLAVVADHLPVSRRMPWRMIEAVSRGVLAPVVRSMEL
jgi:hypothetical protein